MTPVTPSMASDFVAAVDKSCQVLRGLLAVQPDVLVKLPTREIQKARAELFSLQRALNAWIATHHPEAGPMLIREDGEEIGGLCDADAIHATHEDLHTFAAALRFDALDARLTGCRIQFGSEDADTNADLLIEAADAIGALLRERGTPAPNTERV